MPVNRNALIRYKTIDNCLQNRRRKWTLNDLIEACSEALYEYEGIEKGVSRRTIQMDIQMMRSEKLGYHAPIIVVDKKYYTYEDPSYSITNIPLTDQDLDKLTEVVEILRQFKGFTHFRELSGMVQRLEDKIHTSKSSQRPIIDLEKNEQLQGLEHIDKLYQAILNKDCLRIAYKSFKASTSNVFHFDPYLLKEYRNRWFVLGARRDQPSLQLLALDRIRGISLSHHSYISPDESEIQTFFRDVIGVTVNRGGKLEEVKLFVDRSNAPYVITKPIHHSQKIIEQSAEGIVITLNVKLNFELEREILGFGELIQVLEPIKLKRRLKDRLRLNLDQYETELDEKALRNYTKRFEAKGFIIQHRVYSLKVLRHIKNRIYTYRRKSEQTENPHWEIDNMEKAIPGMSDILLNRNLKRILARISPKLNILKIKYFENSAETGVWFDWKQGRENEANKKSLFLRIYLQDSNTNHGVLRIIPGTHKKKLNPEEIELITQNTEVYTCDISAGGILFMHPLLLHSFPKPIKPKSQQMIFMELNPIVAVP